MMTLVIILVCLAYLDSRRRQKGRHVYILTDNPNYRKDRP